MLCHAPLWAPPLQLRYMKLNQDQTIWDKKWSAIWEHLREHNGNLGNTLGRNKRQTTAPLSWLLDIINNILYIDNLFSGWMLIIIIHAQNGYESLFIHTHTQGNRQSFNMWYNLGMNLQSGRDKSASQLLNLVMYREIDN